MSKSNKSDEQQDSSVEHLNNQENMANQATEESSTTTKKSSGSVRIPPPDGRPLLERFGLADFKWRTPTLDDL